MIARALILLFGLSISLNAMAEDFDDAQRASLANGDVVIEDVTNAEGISGLRAAFLLKARPEAIWNLLVDYKDFREIFPNVEELWVLEQNEKGARVRYRIRAAWMTFLYTLQRDYEEPGRRLTWRRVDGDFKHITGQWSIRKWSDDEHQLVIYESFLDVGYQIPTALVRSGAAKEIRNTVRLMRLRLERNRGAD